MIKFNDWYNEAIAKGIPDYSKLPACPCSIRCNKTSLCDLMFGYSGHYVPCLPPGWKLAPPVLAYPTLDRYHPGAKWDIRSFPGDPSQQCTYDEDFKLIESGPGVGTVGTVNAFPLWRLRHPGADVVPIEWILILQGAPLSDGCWFNKYLELRPANGGKPCEKTSQKHRDRWWNSSVF